MHKIRKKCTPLFKLFGVFYFVYRKGITKGAPSYDRRCSEGFVVNCYL